MVHSTRRAFVAAALCASVRGDSWQGFPDWSDGKVHSLLTDSPWAKRIAVRIRWYGPNEQPITYRDVPGASATGRASSTIQGGSPVGGIGTPKEDLPRSADLIVRWASALPVRQATALYKVRDQKLDAARIPELIEPASPDYVLEVFGIPAVVAHKGDQMVALAFQQSALLRTHKRVLRATKATVTVNALTLTARIHFSRAEPIEAADGELECYADAQVFAFRQKFKPRAMTYQGQLEI